ncbi:hypothetical protein [Actinophytocola xinjiangensis]|nr:hypothetical protein [Actinophytocola xinjiangensis]
MTLPVPISFELPNGWFPADPAEAGAPGMLFVAKHPSSSMGPDRVSTNISISGYRRDGVDPATIADESLERLRTGATVEVIKRTPAGSSRAPGFTQLLGLVVNDNGREVRLLQQQVYLSMPDVDDPHKRATVEFMFTCAPRRYQELIGDFVQFLRTVTPVTRR